MGAVNEVKGKKRGFDGSNLSKGTLWVNLALLELEAFSNVR